MQSIEIRRARALMAAIGLLAAVLACFDTQHSTAGQATPPAERGAASGSPSHASEAEAEIARANLGGRMQAALGGAFGGVWFEPSTAQMHVGVTSAASRRQAETLAAQLGLSAIVTETQVDSTWTQLAAAQARWNRRLVDLFEQGRVSTSLAPDLNSLQIELASTVPAGRRAALERDAAAADVEVEVSVAPQPSFHFGHAERCKKFAKFESYCDPTIVAGVNVASEGGKENCTAGPAARLKDHSTGGKATRTFILTAGHCIAKGGGSAKFWSAFNKGGEPKTIGESHVYVNGKYDIGAIEVTPTYWANANDPIPVLPAIALLFTIGDYNPTEVFGHSKPVKGTETCFAGQRSGSLCGTVEAESETHTFDGEAVATEKLVKVKLKNGAKGGKGDSGGPFYSGTSASTMQGVMVGFEYEDAKKEEGNIVYFHSMETSFSALEELGLSLELLKNANKRRKHPSMTAEEYPLTVAGSDGSAEDLFTAFGATVACTADEYHGEMTESEHEEEPAEIEVIPAYAGCTGPLGTPVGMTGNGCGYELRLVEEVSEGKYSAKVDVVCPAGQPGIQFHIAASHANLTSGTVLCTLTVPPQSELGTITLTNSGGDVVVEKGTVEGVKVKIHRKSVLCPSTGTENETTAGVLHNEAVTMAGSSGGEAVDVDVGSE